MSARRGGCHRCGGGRCDTEWADALATFPGGDSIGTERSVRIVGGRNDCAVVGGPVLFAHVDHIRHDRGRVEGVFGISFPRQRLDLKQGEISPQVHRLVGTGQTQVREQRTEPAIVSTMPS